MLTSGLQYLVQKMNYNRDLKRVHEIRDQARAAAWGQKMTPLEGQRKAGSVPDAGMIPKLTGTPH